MKVFLVWLIVCGIWSSTWIFIKFGLEEGLPPISFAAIRFIVAAAVLLLILAVFRISLPNTKRDWLLAAATGVLQFFINYALLFWGEQYISSGLAAVLQTTIPAFGLILAQFHLPDERITPLKIFAIALGMIGVGAIFYEQLDISGRMALAGSAAVVIGAFFAAYASVLVKAFGSQTDSSSLLTAQMLCGLVPLALVGFGVEGNPLFFNWTQLAVVSVLYLALIGSIAAFWLYYWLLKHTEVMKAMTVALVTPFVAVLIGNLVLGETLQWQTLIGGVLILFSVGLILFQPKRESVKDSPSETVLESR